MKFVGLVQWPTNNQRCKWKISTNCISATIAAPPLHCAAVFRCCIIKHFGPLGHCKVVRIIDFKAYSEIICEPNSMLFYIKRNMKTSITFNESQKLRYYENVAARLKKTFSLKSCALNFKFDSP